MLQHLKAALTKTLYRQLVVAVTLVLTVTLSVFGTEMLRRQQHQEMHRRGEQVAALAHSLATSSGVWVSSRNFSGLQEIVQGVAQFPDLRYAMVLDTTGLVLAHLDLERRGQYLTDLPEQVHPRTLQMADHVTDVTQPILLGNHHTGWVRVGVSNGHFDAEFSKTRRDIVLFTIFSIAIGTLLASVAARYQTRRLRQVERVARALQQGHSLLRAEVSGTDEAAQLAGHFNRMLDQIADRERALQKSATLLRQSQQLGKIGGWEWDTETSTLHWTAETFRIHDMPVDADSWMAQADMAKSIACIHPDDREALLRAFSLCIETGTPYDMECRFVSVKHRHLWIRTQGQAEIRDGKVVKVFGYIADITERKNMEEEIRSLAYFDPLTTLPNRRMLLDRLQSAMAVSHRNGSHGALIYLDLDNFKPLNDKHGHAAGDLLLIEVAKRLLHCVRQIDTVARTGGDEFVVILTGLSTAVCPAHDECQQIAGKILAALSMPYLLSIAPDQPQAPMIEHHCTASMGVTLFKGQDLSLQEVIRKADAAMYQAKESGRNRIQFD